MLDLSSDSHTWTASEAQCLKILLYFDIFAHPLTEDELLSLATCDPVAKTEMKKAIASLIAKKAIRHSDPYLHLPTNHQGVAARQVKEKRAQDMWPLVPRSVRILSAFPFVRGLSITGTLAKDAVGEDADIDFVVFTAADRVWICRTFIASTRRLLPYGLRQLCCTNVYLSQEALEYDQKTAYVAAEIGLSRPVYGQGVGQAFFQANHWLQGYLPGLEGPPEPPIAIPQRQKRPRLTRLLEKRLSGPMGDRLESLLPQLWGAFWAYKYKGLDRGDRKRRFRTQKTVSTNHYNNYQAKVMEAYQKRLNDYGLKAPNPTPA